MTNSGSPVWHDNYKSNDLDIEPVSTTARESMARIFLSELGFSTPAMIEANSDHSLVRAAYRAADRIMEGDVSPHP